MITLDQLQYIFYSVATLAAAVSMFSMVVSFRRKKNPNQRKHKKTTKK